MRNFVAITYFYGSTFAVAIGKTLLIFSYHEKEQEELLPVKINDRDFSGFNNIVVFSPHAVAEHFSEVIFTWKKSFPISYVLHEEARDRAPDMPNVHFVREGNHISIADVDIKVTSAAGEGVSFLVESHGISAFHAGDLNLWHWRDETPPTEIIGLEEKFYNAVASIPKQPLDICMFPVDPNIGTMFEAGANHAIMALKPRLFLPMHFGKHGEMVKNYARTMKFRGTEIYALIQPRETIHVDFTDATIAINKVSQGLESEKKLDSRYNLSAYVKDNPFADTDLPVDLS